MCLTRCRAGFSRYNSYSGYLIILEGDVRDQQASYTPCLQSGYTNCDPIIEIPISDRSSCHLPPLSRAITQRLEYTLGWREYRKSMTDRISCRCKTCKSAVLYEWTWVDTRSDKIGAQSLGT